MATGKCQEKLGQGKTQQGREGAEVGTNCDGGGDGDTLLSLALDVDAVGFSTSSANLTCGDAAIRRDDVEREA